MQILARHLFAELLGRFFCWGIALDIVTSVAPSSTFSVLGSWGQTATMRGPRCFFCVAQLSAPMEGQFENKFKHFQNHGGCGCPSMLVMMMHMCPAQPPMRADMDVLDALHDNTFFAIATAAGATSAGATSGTGTKQENHYCTVQTPCMRMLVTLVQTCPRVIMAAQPHSLVAEHVSFLEEQDSRPQAYMLARRLPFAILNRVLLQGPRHPAYHPWEQPESPRFSQIWHTLRGSSGQSRSLNMTARDCSDMLGNLRRDNQKTVISLLLEVNRIGKHINKACPRPASQNSTILS